MSPPVRTLVGTPDPDPDLAARIAALKAELGATNPMEQPEAYNRLFGDLVALEQQRRLGPG